MGRCGVWVLLFCVPLSAVIPLLYHIAKVLSSICKGIAQFLRFCPIWPFAGAPNGKQPGECRAVATKKACVAYGFSRPCALGGALSFRISSGAPHPGRQQQMKSSRWSTMTAKQLGELRARFFYLPVPLLKDTGQIKSLRRLGGGGHLWWPLAERDGTDFRRQLVLLTSRITTAQNVKVGLPSD